MFEKILDGQKILRIQKTGGQTTVTEPAETQINIKETTAAETVVIKEKDTEKYKKIDKEEEKELKPKKSVPTIEHLKRMKEI